MYEDLAACSADASGAFGKERKVGKIMFSIMFSVKLIKSTRVSVHNKLRNCALVSKC